MNDQTVKADAGKLKLTLVPRQIIKDICEVREYGNAKYPEGGPDNWKQVDIQRYRDALFRHFMAYLDDPHGVDEESGIKHYKHMACNMAFLCEMENKNIRKTATAMYDPESNTIFVRHNGYWNYKDNEIFSGEYFCSECRTRAEVDLYGEWILSDYCPHCGAKMLAAQINNERSKEKDE